MDHPHQQLRFVRRFVPDTIKDGVTITVKQQKILQVRNFVEVSGTHTWTVWVDVPCVDEEE